MSAEVTFAILLTLALVFFWLSRELHPPRGGQIFIIGFGAAAVLLAIGASIALAQVSIVTTVLSSIAGIGEWPTAALGLAAVAAPLLVILVVLPASWCKLAISSPALAGFTLMVPLQAYPLPGAIGQFGVDLTQFMTLLVTALTAGLVTA